MQRWGLCLLALAASACSQKAIDCSKAELSRTDVNTCQMPGWSDRNFNVHLPATSSVAQPVLVFFHGGTGSKRRAIDTTCPEQDASSPACLRTMALARGYVVVVPDGTNNKGLNLRTYNAGGGIGKFRCTSGKACSDNVDDVKYFDDLMTQVSGLTNIDASRVYLTGISNGAAMSYRLACDRSQRVAAIAPVGGANQAIVAPGCTPTRAVPVLHIHGTADPAWLYEGGTPQTPLTGQGDKEHVGVEETVIGGGEFTSWTELAGCTGEPTTRDLPDEVQDGTTSDVRTWSQCKDGAEVQLVRITGGGHTWPRGDQYLSVGAIGPVAQDFDANGMILDFFARFRTP